MNGCGAARSTAPPTPTSTVEILHPTALAHPSLHSNCLLSEHMLLPTSNVCAVLTLLAGISTSLITTAPGTTTTLLTRGQLLTRAANMVARFSLQQQQRASSIVSSAAAPRPHAALLLNPCAQRSAAVRGAGAVFAPSSQLLRSPAAAPLLSIARRFQNSARMAAAATDAPAAAPAAPKLTEEEVKAQFASNPLLAVSAPACWLLYQKLYQQGCKCRDQGGCGALCTPIEGGCATQRALHALHALRCCAAHSSNHAHSQNQHPPSPPPPTLTPNRTSSSPSGTRSSRSTSCPACARCLRRCTPTSTRSRRP